MITETEAKKKWCPFVGAHGDPQHGGGINRNPDRQCDFNCIASECMAWRWGFSEPSNKGFCGLAGKEQ